MAKTALALLCLAQVEEKVGIKHSKIYQLIKEDKFPSPVRLGSRSVRWRSDSIESWIESISTPSAKGPEA